MPYTAFIDRRGKSQLALIHQVTDRLVRTLDFDHALHTLIEGATELLGVDRGSILILDPASGTLSIRVAKGLSDDVVRKTRIRLGEGIAGEVARSGQAVALRDVREHPGWKRRRREATAQYADFSALCVPLEIHGSIHGVMTFNQKRSGQPFTPADLEFALLIANQAAVALFSAMLHRHYLDKQALDQELRLARTIQKRLLPQAPGDLLVLFTDGLWEATDVKGRRFGTAGLERAILAHRRRSEEEIVEAIFAAAARHRSTIEPDDDCTLIALRAI